MGKVRRRSARVNTQVGGEEGSVGIRESRLAEINQPSAAGG